MWYDVCVCFLFFFKQKTAYEMRISDWSSDVCSSDLGSHLLRRDEMIAMAAAIDRRVTMVGMLQPHHRRHHELGAETLCEPAQRAYAQADPQRRHAQLGRASCRDRVCPYV